MAGPRRGRAHSRRGAALRARASRRVRLLGGPAARSHPPYVCTPTATRRPSPTANDYCSQIRDCQWPLPSVSLLPLNGLSAAHRGALVKLARARVIDEGSAPVAPAHAT